MRRMLAGVVALLMLLAGGGMGAAQEASPAALPTLPTTPDPGLCTVAPRPVAEVEAALATPPPPAPTGFAPPPGRPADPATVAAVTATLVELFACENGGDVPRAAALYTPAGFREDYGHGQIALTLILARDEPVPIPAYAWASVLAVREVAALADGRVGAVVEVEFPEGPATDYVFFAAEGGRYLVDLWVDEYRAPVGTPLPGTPAP
jgi:hypothetical protein